MPEKQQPACINSNQRSLQLLTTKFAEFLNFYAIKIKTSKGNLRKNFSQVLSKESYNLKKKDSLEMQGHLLGSI